jgi:hypothetical protein
MSANSPKFSDMFLALSNDPHMRLDACLARYSETENPVFFWEALKVCTDHNLPYPDWVCSYLSAVANLMLNDEVRKCSDLREVLPHVLLFPKKKSGPGRPLDPDAEPDERKLFTIKFIRKLEDNHECKPSEALKEVQGEMDTSLDFHGSESP